MKSPRPCSYHQKATAVASSRASSALATRLRSSLRWATRLILASGSRGARRRRSRGPRPGSLTVVLLEGSARPVERAGLVGAGPQLGGTCLRDTGLLVQLRAQVTGRRGLRGGGDLAADGRGGGGVAGAHVVLLHALHLALEDAQGAAQGAGCVGELLVSEEQQDREHDQAALHRAEIHRSSWGRGGISHAMPGSPGRGGPKWGLTEVPVVGPDAARAAVCCTCSRTGRTSRPNAATSRPRRGEGRDKPTPLTP